MGGRLGQSTQYCFQGPPPSGGGTTGGGGDNTICTTEEGCTSPIVLNLGTGNYQLTSTSNPVTFDLDANGVAERTAWTAGGSFMAFLALDRNQNGMIDDGSELFGNHTPLASGGVASNGFVALAQYDANRDGVIDARDPIWSSLLLWIDWNHDGIAQPGELRPISNSSVTAVGLSYLWTNRRDPAGNVYRYEAKCVVEGRARPCYDIFFQRVR